MINYITIEAQKRQAVNDIRDPHEAHGPDRELMTFSCGGVELITTADEFEEYLQATGLSWEYAREQLNAAKLAAMLKWFDEEELLYVPVSNPDERDAEITRLKQALEERTAERDLWYSHHKEDTLRLTKERDEARSERDELRKELEAKLLQLQIYEARMSATEEAATQLTDKLPSRDLTDEQKAWYLANSDCCPYCLKGDVRGTGDTDYSGDSIFRSVECTGCGGEWTDVYKLAAVHSVE